MDYFDDDHDFDCDEDDSVSLTLLFCGLRVDLCDVLSHGGRSLVSWEQKVGVKASLVRT